MNEGPARVAEGEVTVGTVGLLVVDAIGQLCPVPVLRVSQGIKQLKVGDEMEVWATDPGSKSDIAAWTRMTGNELVTVSEEDIQQERRVGLEADVERKSDSSVHAYKFRIRKMR